ncbi:MAG: hypothetical protein ABEJ60_05870 [Halodesulfurarchaeum sp.]
MRKRDANGDSLRERVDQQDEKNRENRPEIAFCDVVGVVVDVKSLNTVVCDDDEDHTADDTGETDPEISGVVVHLVSKAENRRGGHQAAGESPQADIESVANLVSPEQGKCSDTSTDGCDQPCDENECIDPPAHEV